jgi:hypothetical protein
MRLHWCCCIRFARGLQQALHVAACAAPEGQDAGQGGKGGSLLVVLNVLVFRLYSCERYQLSGSGLFGFTAHWGLAGRGGGGSGVNCRKRSCMWPLAAEAQTALRVCMHVVS